MARRGEDGWQWVPSQLRGYVRVFHPARMRICVVPAQRL